MPNIPTQFPKKLLFRKKSLSVYFDDYFVLGAQSARTLQKKKRSIAMLWWDTLIELGRITNTNMNVKKCKGPAKCLDILGFGSIPIKKPVLCPVDA